MAGVMLNMGLKWVGIVVLYDILTLQYADKMPIKQREHADKSLQADRVEPIPFIALLFVIA